MRSFALSQFGRFALVGTLGFVVDSGFTLTLIHRGIDPFTARAFAIALAMMVTWRLNRALTFGASGTSEAEEGFRYFTVAVIAAILNYAIYVGLLLAIPTLSPLIALVLAIGAVTLLSFLGYRRLVFKAAA
ncbi:MAG: GtrA family protein [Hyphomonadaceae bacterium]|nr:GtrA family protein [Hyphomonadaceae bacterium]